MEPNNHRRRPPRQPKAQTSTASGTLELSTALPYTPPSFTFVETALFTKLVPRYLTDAEYAALQAALATNPDCGAIVKGSGGLRKVRWRTTGRGKRGGVRVVYFVRHREGVIWMLTIFAKNVKESIPTHMLRRIAQEIERD